MGKERAYVWKKFGIDAALLENNLTEALARSSIWHELNHAQAPVFAPDDTRETAKFDQMTGGMTNTSYKFSTKKGLFFVRVPGMGSAEHLSRQDEAYNLKIVNDLNFNIDLHYLNPKTGLYAGEFLQNSKNLTPDLSNQTLREIAGIFKKLHTHDKPFNNDIEIFDRLYGLLAKIDKYKHKLLFDRKELNQRLRLLRKICKQDQTPLVPCHNDPTYLNFLVHNDKLRLLDWEYSGNNHAMFDLANFSLTTKLSKTAQNYLLQAYYGISPTKQVWNIFSAYKQATNLWWYLWAEVQIANKSNVVPLKELIQTAQDNWHHVMGSEIHFFREPKNKAMDNTSACKIKPNKFG